MIGGGPIGIEMAQAHRRLGARVTVLDLGPLLPRDDPELVASSPSAWPAKGSRLRPRVAIAVGRAREGAGLRSTGRRRARSPARICWSPPGAGRVSRRSISPAAGIAADPHGIIVDARLRTTNRRAFAVGDVAGGPQFTHVALYQAGIVIRNALFRLPAKVDYRALPWVTYTDPELAQVGLTEAAARATLGDAIRVLRWPFAETTAPKPSATPPGWSRS